MRSPTLQQDQPANSNEHKGRNSMPVAASWCPNIGYLTIQCPIAHHAAVIVKKTNPIVINS